jgi:hypothetical protein
MLLDCTVCTHKQGLLQSRKAKAEKAATLALKMLDMSGKPLRGSVVFSRHR